MSQERRFKGVVRALNEGLLVPLTGKSLHLLPEEECMVYAVFRPSPTKRGWLQGKLKKIKGSISIRLVGKFRRFNCALTVGMRLSNLSFDIEQITTERPCARCRKLQRASSRLAI